MEMGMGRRERNRVSDFSSLSLLSSFDLSRDGSGKEKGVFVCSSASVSSLPMKAILASSAGSSKRSRI